MCITKRRSSFLFFLWDKCLVVLRFVRHLLQYTENELFTSPRKNSNLNTIYFNSRNRNARHLKRSTHGGGIVINIFSLQHTVINIYLWSIINLLYNILFLAQFKHRLRFKIKTDLSVTSYYLYEQLMTYKLIKM